MEHQKEAQMVYIKDLLFTVLYRWRTVLAVTLVMALLLGGLGFVMGGRALSPEDAQKVEIYEAEKAAMDQRVTTLQKSIVERQTHLENSMLMKLDPYNHYEAQLTISVQVEADTSGFSGAFDTQAVLEAYREVLTEGSFLAQLAQQLQLQEQYVSELISSEAVSIGADTVTVCIKCDSTESAAALAEIAKTHLEQYQAQVEEKIVPHSMNVLKNTALAKADTALAETQRVEVVRLAEMLSALTDARNKRNALTKPDAADAGAPVKNAILLAVVGAFAGVFVTVCLLWIGHIGSGKVYSGRTLCNRTGVKVLGCVDSGSKRGPIQKWLRKLEGRSVSTDPTVIAADISFRTGAEKLLVAGNNEASRKALVKVLQEAMPQTKILESGNLLESREALAALVECEAVVLVETCGSSRYQAVLQQTEKMKDYGKQLIGCVVVDG